MLKESSVNEIMKIVGRRISMKIKVIIIPIIEYNHVIATYINLQKKVVVIMDSLYTRTKINVFKKVFQVISAVLTTLHQSLIQIEWAAIQPSSCIRQRDGFNCGIYAILNMYNLIHHTEQPYSHNELPSFRKWILHKIITIDISQHSKRKCKRKFIIPVQQAEDIELTPKDIITEISGKDNVFAAILSFVRNHDVFSSDSSTGSSDEKHDSKHSERRVSKVYKSTGCVFEGVDKPRTQRIRKIGKNGSFKLLSNENLQGKCAFGNIPYFFFCTIFKL